MPILIILLVLIVVLVVPNVRIVPQAHCYVIERLGRYLTTWNAGIHVKLPVVDRVARRVSLKEQVLDFPPQSVITKDNVTMKIDSVVYAKIFDPVKYCYGVEDPLMGLQNLSSTTLRSVIGNMELDTTLSAREDINNQLRTILDEGTDEWGLKVTRVELKNIQPPREIEEVMTKQMRAERERRQTLLEAEAHRDAVELRATGDKEATLLAAQAEAEAQKTLAEGRAAAIDIVSKAEAENLRRLSEAGTTEAVLRLQAIKAMKDIADGQATKIFLPTDMASMLSVYGAAGEMFGTAKPPQKAKPRTELRKDQQAVAARKTVENDECLHENVSDVTRGAADATASDMAAMSQYFGRVDKSMSEMQAERSSKRLDHPGSAF